MRENSQELERGLIEEQAKEWRPRRYGSNSVSGSKPTDLPENSASHRAITICITKGRSVQSTLRMAKSRVSIGKMGGGADMQIDDLEVSPLHCAVAITGNGLKLYDLDSVTGTYVDDERIQVADLQNLSAFRIGSTEFVVSIVANTRTVTKPKNPVLVAFGKRLRQIREKRGLSQERLAELADLHRNTVGSLERGEVNISLLAIASLAKVLRVKPAELIKTVHPI